MRSLTGTRALIRFIIRRDRARLPIWVLGIAGFFSLVAASFPDIYPTVEERQARAALMENPTAILFRGPGHGLEDYTYGAMLAHELLGFAAVAAALMSIFLVIRHTRTEEEHGRLELVRSAVVGRYAAPVAALTVVFVANLALAAVMTALLTTTTSVYPLTGALAFGLSVASVGIVFAAIAALTAQLTESSRTASSMAALAVGAAYLLRGIGDIREGVLSWLSPIGWAQATRPFVDERWWPLLLALGVSSGVIALAFLLIDRRDVAAGLLPQRPGPAGASGQLSRPLGFALRQQRGSLIGWSLGVLTLGVAFGSLVGDVEEFIGEVSGLEDFLGAGDPSMLLDAFLSLLVMVLAFLAGSFAIQSALRIRGEETGGRAEAVLSTAISRPAWMWSYLLVALLGSAVVLLAGSLGVGVTAALNQNDPDLIRRVGIAGLAYVPAVWTLTAAVAVLFGLVPRVSAAPWLALVYGVFAGLFGEMVQMPGWMLDLSPFEHVPQLQDGEYAMLPIVALTLLSAGLLAAGLFGFRRRDLETA